MKLTNKALSVFRWFLVLAPQAAGSPLVDRCVTTEKDGLMRCGAGWLIRLPWRGHKPTIGLVLGRWRA